MGTYDEPSTANRHLEDLLKSFQNLGVTRVFWKPLSPNDNSKNQIYLGGDLSSLNIIPTGPLELHAGSSNKPETKAGKSLIKAPLNLYWLAPNDDLIVAPNAQIILYPQYPEVRMSGFLRGSKVRISEWMSPEKKGRFHGRNILFGVKNNGQVLAYLAVPNSSISRKLESLDYDNTIGPLRELLLTQESTTKTQLITALTEIHQKGWHASIRLAKNTSGHIRRTAYSAPNGGGYTLEALLNIFPNGDSAPDYLGWEVKQYGVSSCKGTGNTSKAITLMTPEPDGGDYKEIGVNQFIKQYGYQDKLGRAGRMNFGGTHYYQTPHATTKLTLNLGGQLGGGKFDPTAALELISHDGKIAASWSYVKLLDHWKKKHSKTVYIPSISKKTTPKEYLFCSPIYLGEGTSFSKYLSAILDQKAYYDPGIKLEVSPNGREKTKRRSQFRIRFKDVQSLYEKWSTKHLT